MESSRKQGAPSAEAIELWRERKVLQMIGVSRSTVWAMVRKSEFPAPVKICHDGRAVGWPSNEVRAWIQARIAASRKVAA